MNPDLLSQFLIDITRGSLRTDFGRSAAAVIDASPLDAPTREAVRDADLASLWRAGAHPMALLLFSRLCGWPSERYYTCVAEAEAQR